LKAHFLSALINWDVGLGGVFLVEQHILWVEVFTFQKFEIPPRFILEEYFLLLVWNSCFICPQPCQLQTFAQLNGCQSDFH
jgi:hypothetical protein